MIIVYCGETLENSFIFVGIIRVLEIFANGNSTMEWWRSQENHRGYEERFSKSTGC